MDTCSVIVSIIGTRPQLIKASVVSTAIRSNPAFREVLIETGQHYDPQLARVFFEELGIPEPDHHLNIGSGPHAQQTGRMLEAIGAHLEAIRPALVLVYGDTNSTLAGVLAASKLNIPVAHVEAGLRSFNRRMPEEQNRVVADHLSDLLFAPTNAAIENLLHEGVPLDRIRNVGDVMLDVARSHGRRALERNSILGPLGLEARRFVLATIHRAENTDNRDRLEGIVAGLKALSRELPVVLPLHPRTAAALEKAGIDLSGVVDLHLIEPVGYLDMVALEQRAAVILTDSGGVQKEAYFHGVHCVTVRDETEWVETVAVGCNVLVEADPARILQAVTSRLDAPWPVHSGLYGDGDAAGKIVLEIQKYLAKGAE